MDKTVDFEKQKVELEKKLENLKEQQSATKKEIARVKREQKREIERLERERIARERQEQIDEYVKICDEAKELPSGQRGISLYTEFKDNVTNRVKKNCVVDTQGSGDA